MVNVTTLGFSPFIHVTCPCHVPAQDDDELEDEEGADFAVPHPVLSIAIPTSTIVKKKFFICHSVRLGRTCVWLRRH